MATDKQFKVFGTSKQGDSYKVRFANDTMRVKVLEKHGHTDVILVELSEAVSKYEGIQAIKDLPQFANAASQMAITEYLSEKAPKAVAKAPAKKAVKSTKAADKALEDAPF
jgi:hypothetical protein